MILLILFIFVVVIVRVDVELYDLYLLVLICPLLGRWGGGVGFFFELLYYIKGGIRLLWDVGIGIGIG